MDLTARDSSIKEESKYEDDVTCLSDHESSSNGTKESCKNGWSVLGVLPPDEKSVFSYEQTITLLKEVKANWNRLCDKSVKKDDVWNEISAVVGIDKKKCNQKFRNIKDRYKKYRDSVSKGFRDLKQPTFFNEIDDILRNTDLSEGSDNNKDLSSAISSDNTIPAQGMSTLFHVKDNPNQQTSNRKRKLNSYVNPVKVKADILEKSSLFGNCLKRTKTVKSPEPECNNMSKSNNNGLITTSNSHSTLDLPSNIPESVPIAPGCSNDAFLSRPSANLSNELFLNHLRNNGELSLLNPLALLPGLLNNQVNGLLKHSNDPNGFEPADTSFRNSSFSSAHHDRQLTSYQAEKLSLLRRLVDAVERHNDLLEKHLIHM